MPITNLTKSIQLKYTVTAARNFLARLIGLQHTTRPDAQKAFFIQSCNGIHTIGMNYSIDIVFLNRCGKVVKLFQNVSPNKITGLIPSAYSALEFPAYIINDREIELGDQLKIVPDECYEADLQGLQKILHWPTNFLMALLWSSFALSAYRNWDQNGEILSLGLVFVNTLLFFLFLTRRESKEISYRILDWIIPIITVGLSMFLRPDPAITNNLLNGFSVAIQIFGISGILFSFASLGRSFGVIPANREIKISGAYKFVRHPIYASEILFYLGFLIGNGSIFNFCAIALIVLGQIYRAYSEETLLSKEKLYSDYKANVPYRFLPKIY